MHTPTAGVGDELVDQVRLADTGLADQLDERGPATDRVQQAPVQHVPLAHAPDTRRRLGRVRRGDAAFLAVSGRGRRRPRQGRLEPRGLLENGILERPQLGAGIDPEVLGQHTAHGAQSLERVGLATGAHQRDGVDRPQPLAQLVSTDRRLGGGQDAGVLTERQQA